MTRALPLMLVLLASACTPLPPFPATPGAAPAAAAPLTEKERLVAAIEANGCQLDPSNAAQVLAASGLPDDSIVRIGKELVDEGQANVMTTGVFELKTDRCI